MSYRIMGASHGVVFERGRADSADSAIKSAQRMCERNPRLFAWVVTPKGTKVAGFRTHAITGELVRD